MTHARWSLGIVCAFLMALAAAGRAGEPDQAAQAFESLYGSDVKRVRATRGPADDIELAARLLAAAKEATGQPAFLAVLCEKAAELAGPHPDGVATAIAAMDFLTSQVPEKAGACAERVLTIRQKQFEVSRGAERPAAGEALIDALLAAAEHKQAAGAAAEAVALCRRAQAVARGVNSPRAGEIDARQKALAEAMKTEREIADIKALLEKSPGNTALREKLVRIYLVQKDDPAEAAKHLEGVKDASLRKYVPAVAKGAEAAPELACMELGEWYRGLGEAAPDAAKAAMYARAKAYYERFLELHTPEDLARTTASLALKKVDAELAKLGGPPAPMATVPKATPASKGTIKPGKWVDLLPFVDPAKDAVKGKWKRQGSAIAITKSESHSRTAIPVAPQGSYELEVRFVRASGNEDVNILLPVSNSRVMLMLSGWGGTVSGLELINGKRASSNETTVKPGALENGRQHYLQINVLLKGDQAQIAVRLDGKPYLRWRGPHSALSMLPYWRLPTAGCLGLGAYSTVVFHSVRLKMLSGEARLLRPTGTAAKTPSTAKPTPAPSGKTVRTGQWVDLVPLVDLSRHAVKGTWEERDGTLVLTDAPGGGRAMIPAVPLGSYELEVTCRRTWGDSTMAIILPVASTGVAVSLDYDHGSASGLDRVNGESPKNNETRVKAVHMKGNREYVVHSKVQVAGPAAQIDVTVDGQPYIAWKGPLAALSMPKQWQLPTPQAIGLGAFFSRAQFRNIRLKMLTGRAVLPPAKK